MTTLAKDGAARERMGWARPDAWVTHAGHVLRATRWQVIAIGPAFGGAITAASHLSDAGPFASVHLGIGLGIIGIGLGAAFVLDDPAATTLAAVPTNLRRRTLHRVALAVVVGLVALVCLALLAWESLAYLAVVRQAAGLGAIGMTGAAVAGRLLGRERAGTAGAAAVAGVVIADTVGALPGERVALTGGATFEHSPELAWLWAAIAAIAAMGMFWATRDPATARRPRARKDTR